MKYTAFNTSYFSILDEFKGICITTRFMILIFFQTILLAIVTLSITGVTSLDFGTLKVIFGPKYLYKNVRYVQNPYSGHRNRKAFASEYGKKGSAFIKAVSNTYIRRHL